MQINALFWVFGTKRDHVAVNNCVLVNCSPDWDFTTLLATILPFVVVGFTLAERDFVGRYSTVKAPFRTEMLGARTENLQSSCHYKCTNLLTSIVGKYCVLWSPHKKQILLQ